MKTPNQDPFEAARDVATLLLGMDEGETANLKFIKHGQYVDIESDVGLPCGPSEAAKAMSDGYESVMQNRDGSVLVSFMISPECNDEIARILGITSLNSTDDVYRRGLTLLRIHVDAAQKNEEVKLVDPKLEGFDRSITLPFDVA